MQGQRTGDAMQEHRAIGQPGELVTPLQLSLPVERLGTQSVGMQGLTEQGGQHVQQGSLVEQFPDWIAGSIPHSVPNSDPSPSQIGTPTYAPIERTCATPAAEYCGTAMASGAICGVEPVTMCWQNESDHACDPPAVLP